MYSEILDKMCEFESKHDKSAKDLYVNLETFNKIKEHTFVENHNLKIFGMNVWVVSSKNPIRIT